MIAHMERCLEETNSFLTVINGAEQAPHLVAN